MSLFAATPLMQHMSLLPDVGVQGDGLAVPPLESVRHDLVVGLSPMAGVSPTFGLIGGVA